MINGNVTTTIFNNHMFVQFSLKNDTNLFIAQNKMPEFSAELFATSGGKLKIFVRAQNRPL